MLSLYPATEVCLATGKSRILSPKYLSHSKGLSKLTLPREEKKVKLHDFSGHPPKYQRPFGGFDLSSSLILRNAVGGK